MSETSTRDLDSMEQVTEDASLLVLQQSKRRNRRRKIDTLGVILMLLVVLIKQKKVLSTKNLGASTRLNLLLKEISN